MQTRNILRLIWPLLYVLLLVGKLPAQGDEASWELILPHSRIWSLAVAPSDPTIVYAGGTAVCPDTCSDNLFRSIDGGGNWTTLGVFIFDVFAIAIDPDSSNIVYIVRDSGVSEESWLYRTKNGGETWELWDFGSDYHIGASLDADITIDPNDPNIVYVPLLDGIAKSTDRGKSWTKLATGYPAQWALRIEPDNSSVLYLATWVNGVLKSEDSGESWRAIGLEGQRINALVIDPKRPNILYAATFDEGIYKSVDYGENWIEVNNGLTEITFKNLAIDPLNTDVIYAAHEGGALFRSSNGGANWSEFNLERISFLAFTLDPTNPEILYAGGVGGVHKLDISTLVAVAEENAAAPQTFSLAQNYPNPFNPETVIEYQLQGSVPVRLRIYNVMGQEVRILVDETKRTGAYRVRWDGRDDHGKAVPAGVYFYRIEVGGAARGGRNDFVQTRKMSFLN